MLISPGLLPNWVSPWNMLFCFNEMKYVLSTLMPVQGTCQCKQLSPGCQVNPPPMSCLYLDIKFFSNSKLIGLALNQYRDTVGSSESISRRCQSKFWLLGVHVRFSSCIPIDSVDTSWPYDSHDRILGPLCSLCRTQESEKLSFNY